MPRKTPEIKQPKTTKPSVNGKVPDVETIVIEIPIVRVDREDRRRMHHVDVGSLSLDQGLAALAVYLGLRTTNQDMGNRFVESKADCVRWLLQSIADALQEQSTVDTANTTP